MIEDAKIETANFRAKSEDLRNGVKTEFESLNGTVSKLLSQLNELSTESMRMASAARDLVDEGLDLVDGE